ncbi:MAG: hypothetical protein Q4F95_01265 [Oscillospiraceae bacterium]|nr:hypothetical protein [Oscillospiraceae bacterium]
MIDIGSNNFILCLGDDIRYRFAQELMPDGFTIDSNSLKIKKSYVFIHADEENIINDENKILVYTSLVPEGRIMEFPVSGVEIKTVFSSETTARIGKILLFADFPYNKENLHYLLDRVCRKSGSADINVVLYNEHRRAGYTDIQKSDEILREAYDEFGAFNVKIFEYTPSSQKDAVFAIRPDNCRYFEKKYLKELKASVYRLKNRFDIHYKTFLERTYEHYFSLSNPEEFTRFVKLFEYANVCGSDDILASFREDFKRMYLESDSDIMCEISDFYTDYISEIMSFRIKDESTYIKNESIKLFDAFLSDPRKISALDDEFEYKQMLNKNNIITEFSKKVEEYFLHKLKEMLYETAREKISSICTLVEYNN